METLFNSLRPLCIEVSKTRSCESIDELHAVVEQCIAKQLQEIHEYLLFPLRIVLQKGTVKEDAAIRAANCLGAISQKIAVTNWSVYQDVLKTLLLRISTVDEGAIASDGSEDLKIAIINCLALFVQHSVANLWSRFYSVHNFPLLGHLVTICLTAAVSGESRALKLSAMSVIEVICSPLYSKTLSEAEQDTFLLLRADCLSSFLPGILSSLSKVVLGDVKQGHAVKSKALSAASELLTVVLSDHSLSLVGNKSLKTKLHAPDARKVNPKLESLQVKRCEKWLLDTTPKVNTILQKFIAVAQNPSAAVRISLVKFCDTILSSCCRLVLKDSVPTLLNGPLQLLNDGQPSVSKASRDVVEKYINTPNSDAVDVVSDLLFTHCDALPKTLKRSSDEDKLKALQLLFGYLSVLKTDLKIVFHSSVHLKKLLKSLLFCCELDASASISQDEISTVMNDFNVPTLLHSQLSHWHFKKVFLHFTNEAIAQVLVDVCRFLGRYGDVEVLLDHLTSSYEFKSTCCQSVFMVTEVVLGMRQRADKTDVSRHIDNLLDIYCSVENWNLVTSFDSERPPIPTKNRFFNIENSVALVPSNAQKNVNSRLIQFNILLTCLQLEAVSSFSKVLESDFKPKLMTALYPILEKAHETSSIVASCAVKSLLATSVHCGYESVAEMLNDNADYLVSTISVQLRHVNLFPKCPSVLHVLLQHSDVTIFPQIRDTISEILTVLDVYRHDPRHLSLFLPVLLSIVKSTRKWFDLGNKPRQMDSSQRDHVSSSENDIKDFLLEFHKNNEIAAGILDDSDDTSDAETSQNTEKSDPDHFEEIEAEKKCPPEITMIKDVLARCCHLMTNANPKVRLVVMDIAAEAMESLSQDENTLLPLVHLLWSPLLSRFADPELQVISRAFDVVWIMGLTAGDFIQRRFTTDILAKLLQFLKSSFPQCLAVATSSQTMYKHAAQFKLIRNVLEKLGCILLRVQVGFADFQNTLSATHMYLSSNCAQELQDAAVVLFQNLIRVDADAVWYFITDIYAPETVLRPVCDDDFNVIHLSGSNDPSNVYAKNMTVLLNFCEQQSSKSRKKV